MKTLVNKNNPQIRITAPEVEVYGKYYYIKNARLGILQELWTLVEEEPVEEEICSKCIHHGKDDGYCYNPYGGMQYRINENGVCECTGFCEEEQEEPVDLEKEQKPEEWSKNDTVFLNEITDFFENKTVRLQHDLEMYAHWLKSLPKRFNLEPKNKWSEEDKAIIGCIVCCLDGQFVTEAARKQCLEWFNKHRRDFLNQPKQEWSEEDEAHLKWLCRIIRSVRLHGELSLKEESELGKWIDKWINHEPQPKQERR